MARTDDDFEDDNRPRRPRRPRRRDEVFDDDRPPAGRGKLPVILGIIAGVLFLTCGGVTFAVFYAGNKFKEAVVDKAIDKADDARDRVAVTTSLKQIGLAMHEYSDRNGTLPANSYDAAGKPLLSWRVHILPFIEQQALYSQFRPDEPWDSPLNRTLLARMPKTYATPDEGAGRAPLGTTTYYRGFAMPGAVMETKPGNRNANLNFPGGADRPAGTRFAQVTDGLSNTLLCVEAGEAVEWTKPDDLTWTPDRPVPPLGGNRAKSDVFVALFGDGFVRPLKRRITPDQLKAAVTYAGNEFVTLD